ncbi:SDR family NAD(P)-dependent oxidoreductase [Rosistilla oblonga]|uniref:Cyclopentanol dehydrogenase n=1 Tax=Rosistilla oblonga TaxID=2527990 RepID=A0A518IQA1_9BACT|nr:SDR family oxidoreductase [Rosistilla oblonga]QDV55252.1 Cyclopentanol dehydrogenase [Rosistilla oblonga]
MASHVEDSARLKDRTVVVTGGSSGIGRATCLHMAARGAAVVVHYRQNEAGAEETAEAIRAIGGEASIVQADLQSAADRESLVDICWQRHDRIDSWVHNAGADVLTGGAAKLSFQEKLDLLWAVDVRGTTDLARRVGDRMREQPAAGLPASMVFIGWDQAPHGMEGDAGMMFAPVKSAVMALSKSMAQTLAPDVRVNCVAPGWIRTAWGEVADEGWNRRAIDSSLLQRWGSPDDVAAAIAFLCSPAAAFINAQTLEVNGGWNRKP